MNIKWIDEEAIGIIVKRFEFGEHGFEKDWCDKDKPVIQFPKFVYTLLSLGEVIEVLDVDIVRKV